MTLAHLYPDEMQAEGTNVAVCVADFADWVANRTADAGDKVQLGSVVPGDGGEGPGGTSKGVPQVGNSIILVTALLTFVLILV